VRPVDIRFGSPQSGKSASVVLSSEAQNQLDIPPGFTRRSAHCSPEQFPPPWKKFPEQLLSQK